MIQVKTNRHWPTLRRSGLFVLVAAVACAVIFAGAHFWLKRQKLDHEMIADPHVHIVRLGTETLEVPSNTIRFARQRQQGELKRLDLIFLWPELEGLTEKNARAFLGQSEAHFVFASLSIRPMEQDMSGRLHDIYGRLAEGEPSKGPNGLVLYPFRKGSGYDGEVLAVSPDASSGEQFVMRCETMTDDRPATCMRDTHLGQNLSVTYRFDRALLPYWQSIDGELRVILESYLRG